METAFGCEPNLIMSQITAKHRQPGRPMGLAQIETPDTQSEIEGVLDHTPDLESAGVFVRQEEADSRPQTCTTEVQDELQEETKDNNTLELDSGNLLIIESLNDPGSEYPNDILTPVDIETNSYEHPPEAARKKQRTRKNINSSSRNPIRQKVKPKRYFGPEYETYIALVNVQENYEDIPIPKTLKQAISSQYRKQWEEAIYKEHYALINQKVWDLVVLPPGQKAIRSQWLFSVKRQSDGSLDRFKARLVIMGNLQKVDLDYTEVFSPVCRMETMRVFLALAATLDLHVHQLDITSAFLHADLPEPVYMAQPAGTAKAGEEHLVCKLLKALYGLRNSPRLFYKVLHNYLIEIGFTRCQKDHCLYLRKSIEGEKEFLMVYVDDLTIGCSNIKTLEKIKIDLKKRFQITDGGEISFLLKIKIQRDRNNKMIYLSQTQYIKDLLKTYDCEDLPIARTPEPTGQILEKGKVLTAEEAKNPKFPYRNLVGSIMHLQRCTRPNLANATRNLSRYLNCYDERHYKLAIRVLRYLKFTLNLGLVFNGNIELRLMQTYSDSSFGNAELSRKSVTGFAVMMAGAAVCYVSVCQKSISISTMQAELIACSAACRETQWLRLLLIELGFNITSPIDVFCDNTATVQTIKNPVMHSGVKHVDISHLYARELQDQDIIKIQHVRTNDQISDILTKALPEKQFNYLRTKIGVQEVPY